MVYASREILWNGAHEIVSFYYIVVCVYYNHVTDANRPRIRVVGKLYDRRHKTRWISSVVFDGYPRDAGRRARDSRAILKADLADNHNDNNLTACGAWKRRRDGTMGNSSGRMSVSFWTVRNWRRAKMYF